MKFYSMRSQAKRYNFLQFKIFYLQNGEYFTLFLFYIIRIGFGINKNIKLFYFDRVLIHKSAFIASIKHFLKDYSTKKIVLNTIKTFILTPQNNSFCPPKVGVA